MRSFLIRPFPNSLKGNTWQSTSSASAWATASELHTWACTWPTDRWRRETSNTGTGRKVIIWLFKAEKCHQDPTLYCHKPLRFRAFCTWKSGNYLSTCTSRLLSMTPSRTGQKCKMKKIIWCQLMTQCCNPNYSYIYQHNHDTYTQSVILLMADMQNQATLYTRQTFLFSFFYLSFVSLTVCSPLSSLRLVRFTAHALTLRHDRSNIAFQTTQIKCWTWTHDENTW